MAQEAQAKTVSLSKPMIDQVVLDLVPAGLCHKLRTLPISRIHGTLTVAASDSMDVLEINTLAQVTRFHTPTYKEGTAFAAAGWLRVAAFAPRSAWAPSR
jgi:hypothetical protein